MMVGTEAPPEDSGQKAGPSTGPFRLVLDRRPISLQGNGVQKFKAAISGAARTAFGDRPPMRGPLYVRIVWFHRERTTQDVDNIAKPILDSLEGVVFEKDVAVQRCAIEKVFLGDEYELVSRDAPPEIYEALVSSLGSDSPHVLYVECGFIENERRVTIGQIDAR